MACLPFFIPSLSSSTKCLSCAYLALIFQIHPTGQEPSAAAQQPTRTGIAWRTIASLSPQAVFSRLLKTCPRARSYCLPSPTEQIVVTQDPYGSKEVSRANLPLSYTESIHSSSGHSANPILKALKYVLIGSYEKQMLFRSPKLGDVQ